MKKIIRYLALVPAALLLVAVFQNCGQPGSIQVSNPVASINPTGDPTGPLPPVEPPVIADVYGIKILPSNKFICEPFGNMNGGEIKGGLKAELAYVNPSLDLTAATKNAYGVMDYFSDAAQFVKTPTPIFLSQVNVPTRKFDQGFMLSDGSFLSDTNNNKLIEWFALRMKSILKLSPDDQEGLYEIATISDDGSRLFLASAVGANEVEVINNDGAHSARMKCADQPINITRSSKLPMTYFYNQGPRTEIANVMIWRKVNAASSTKYNYCDKVDSNKWWNSANSAPAEYWQAVQADGWKIVDAKNFELPDSQINPCAAQNNNLITKAEFAPLANGMTTLNIDFAMAANIKARLYKIDGAQQTLVQSFDLSAQVRDKISLMVSALENGSTYALEVLLEMPALGNQVVNEVKFQVVKQ